MPHSLQVLLEECRTVSSKDSVAMLASTTYPFNEGHAAQQRAGNDA